jgi:hypothetical protein
VKARAKTHVILTDGSFVKRNSVIDDELVPEKFRSKLDYDDLSPCEGLVMLPRGLGFNKADGSWLSVTAGELVKLSDIPERILEKLTEGVDYIVNWTQQEHLRLREEATQRELQLLTPEPLETTLTGWKAN